MRGRKTVPSSAARLLSQSAATTQFVKISIFLSCSLLTGNSRAFWALSGARIFIPCLTMTMTKKRMSRSVNSFEEHYKQEGEENTRRWFIRKRKKGKIRNLFHSNLSNLSNLLCLFYFLFLPTEGMMVILMTHSVPCTIIKFCTAQFEWRGRLGE